LTNESELLQVPHTVFVCGYATWPG